MLTNQVHTPGALPTASAGPWTSNLPQGDQGLRAPTSVSSLLRLFNTPAAWSVTVTPKQYQLLKQVARNEQKLGAALVHLAQERERQESLYGAAHNAGFLSDGDLAYADDRAEHYQSKVNKLKTEPAVSELISYLERMERSAVVAPAFRPAANYVPYVGPDGHSEEPRHLPRN